MLNVLLTVDTEVWPEVPGWPPTVRLNRVPDELLARIDVDIMGWTAQGTFGIDYQLAMLERHRLKAVYFVEPLFSAYFGAAPLADLVRRIGDAGQEAQLHLHTEWLSDIHEPGLPTGFRQFLHNFNEDEQTALIDWGKRRLEACGAPPVIAFRAGSYGANEETLTALRRLDLHFDSSYNPCYAGGDCRLMPVQPLFGPVEWQGVVEFPVSAFEDGPGRLRHAQLCACSLAELTTALELAYRAGWHCFTIVLHSFEMIRGRTHGHTPRRDPLVTRRFEGLCAYLDSHRDRFRTVGFGDLASESFGADGPPALSIRTGRLLRLGRQVEQALGSLML